MKRNEISIQSIVQSSARIGPQNASYGVLFISLNCVVESRLLLLQPCKML
uniref:Uncharacterized protein n=1 Tax=Arundo donax TaxID=35708 RepID=A0A0A9H6X2_ARUDO